MYCQESEEISNSLELICQKMSTEHVTIHIQEYSYSCRWRFLLHTHTHTHKHIHYSVQHKMLQNSTDTCPVSNVRILGRKKVTHDSQILLNTTQTAFGIMYASNYVTCIYISLSTTQACKPYSGPHTHIHLKVAAMLLHNLCIN